MQHIKRSVEPDLTQRHEPFDYQAEVLKEIVNLPYSAIFLEQGLGKSKVAIDLMLSWLDHKEVDTVLFVAKKGLIENWRKEFAAHSFIRPAILTQNARANFFVLNSPARLMLTSYEVIRSEKDRLKLFLKTRTVAVIVDESAKIKNPGAEITKAFFELAPLFQKRVIMTGTPIANRPYDIWSQIYFLDQGTSLGSDFDTFKANLDLDNKMFKEKDRQTGFETQMCSIFPAISKFSVRKTKDSGIIDLPTKTYKTIVTGWEPRQLDLYKSLRDDLKAVILKEGVPTEDNARSVLKRLLRLIQIASNPRLVDPSYDIEPGKFSYLRDLVLDIVNKGEKCIVWTLFTENADSLSNFLREFNPVRVHGKIAINIRNHSIATFLQDSSCKVLVATPGAAKEGLTLTVANHVIFYDRGFSLDDYLQAQDRIHRISQTKKCFVYNLMMEDSIDVWVDALIRAKELSAKLAQKDISLDFFKSQSPYSFGEILAEILNSKNRRSNNGRD